MMGWFIFAMPIPPRREDLKGVSSDVQAGLPGAARGGRGDDLFQVREKTSIPQSCTSKACPSRSIPIASNQSFENDVNPLCRLLHYCFHKVSFLQELLLFAVALPVGLQSIVSRPGSQDPIRVEIKPHQPPRPPLTVHHQIPLQIA